MVALKEVWVYAHIMGKKHGSLTMLYTSLVLTIAIAIVFVISIPRIAQSIHESGMVDLIRQHLSETRQDDQNRQAVAVLFFPVPAKDGAHFQFSSYPVPIAGILPYHETVEALLAGPPREALAEGAISFIPTRTRLKGLSLSNHIVYVDLSKEFLLPSPWKQDGEFSLRIAQLTQSLTSRQGVRDVVILIDQTPLDELIKRTP